MTKLTRLKVEKNGQLLFRIPDCVARNIKNIPKRGIFRHADTLMRDLTADAAGEKIVRVYSPDLRTH